MNMSVQLEIHYRKLSVTNWPVIMIDGSDVAVLAMEKGFGVEVGAFGEGVAFDGGYSNLAIALVVLL